MRPPAPAARRRARALAPRGFTLFELLVAIAILAFIAIIAWRGVSSLIATRDRLTPQNDQVRALLASFGQMETDLARVPLNVALYAVPVQPVRVVTIDGQRNLQILRLADSPDGSRASAVQMVQYRLHEGALERQSTPAQRFYGAAPAGQLETVAIAPGIVDLQVRVWRNGVGWITPASDADTAGTPGVEVQLQRSDGSVLRRVFMVG